STSCATEISLKRSSACLSPGFRSGWCLRASRRYAFFISSAVAVRSTPRIVWRSRSFAIAPASAAVPNPDLVGSDLAQRGDDLLVVRLDQRTRPLEQLLRPAGGNQDELEAVGNALQAILDRDACHRLKEPPQATTNGNPARRESLDLPR